MSVCLGVTKTIAVSSLGLYAGLLTTTTIVTAATPISVLVPHRKDENDTVLTKYVKAIVCNLGKLSTVLSGLSTVFFGFSYFKAPASAQHPYLLYGMAVAPATFGYLYISSKVSHFIASRSNKTAKADKSPSPQTSLGDSTVDLGKDFKHPKIDSNSDAKCPFSPAAANQDPKCPFGSSADGYPSETAHANCNASMVRDLAIISVFSIAGFAQSVLGIYGEGQFA
ncbi:hypothetical protein TPHA_0J00690 [Tetrapisispora phaffii CBS 4417]|uniref:Autophagy-related protein 33 n=1 Tax=Tetrapisispora phaffii (strain ATCC 24235 / CBS 4417 / NBRC 1672 / NRRL Y-8282 / UCD 70-5) TaxID=1071381 RepID=G8BYF0_TETPH|nr:hypothetical protein TPHA_0J00690 [Tetrapisispora phaffii CBS 4417]CCE64892.1 hypothetical protein TPHA_0J00690 [Tetrapisispora phaffii CBS 4417]